MARLCLNSSHQQYGKDGAAGQHELNVTAQVTLQVETGGISVQPDSSKDCLIGMNTAPALGLSVLDRKGKPPRVAGSVPVSTASVNLIQTKGIPARSRSFVEAGVAIQLQEGECIVFEPDPCS